LKFLIDPSQSRETFWTK